MLARRLPLRGAFTPPYNPSPPYTISGPYDPGDVMTTRVLTQVHCHTTNSDGSYSPATIVASYLAAGYEALIITDHDIVTTQPDGITTKITGNELSPTEQHIVAMNTDYVRGAVTGAQAIIDGIVADGGQAEIAHPAWYRGMTFDEMTALTGHLGFEIHNAQCIPGSGQNPVTYPGFALERWDALLAAGKRPWGFAVDDLHVINAYQAQDVGRLQVFVPSNSLANIMAALVSGNFAADVSNHGVTAGVPERDASGVSLSCTGATKIEAWGAGGLLTSTAGSSHTHTWDGTEEWIRLVAVGDYTEGFGAALSSRWFAVDGTWAASGGVLTLTSAAVRRLILRRHREGDFAAQVDVRFANANDQFSLMFHVLNGSFYYICRVGPSGISTFDDKLAIGYTTDNTFPAGNALASSAFVTSADTWYTIKMDYTAATSTIRAKVWVRGEAEPGWLVSVADTHWEHGAFGFRAGGVGGLIEIDNLYIDGFRTYYQPISVSA